MTAIAELNTSSHSLDDSSLSSMTSEFVPNDDVCRFFQWIFYAVGCQIVDIFGIVANIINIICFARQGFSDSVNVSLFGLAISDLGCLATLLFTNLCCSPIFQDLELPFEPLDMQYLVSAWPHIIFSRVTSWITALITLERCLCITMPLKVKGIITPGRIKAIIVGLFVLLIGSVSPIYCVNYYAWKFSVQRNRTILGLSFSPDREKVETISFAVNNLFVPFIAFMVIITCTVVLVVKLRNKSKWREKSTTSGQAQALTSRDMKVTKLVVVISTIFIGSFLPICFIFIAALLEPELSVDGKYRNITLSLIGLGFILESTNSSINIFLYYRMSSKYRDEFRSLFGLGQQKN